MFILFSGWFITMFQTGIVLDWNNIVTLLTPVFVWLATQAVDWAMAKSNAAGLTGIVTLILMALLNALYAAVTQWLASPTLVWYEQFAYGCLSVLVAQVIKQWQQAQKFGFTLFKTQ